MPGGRRVGWGTSKAAEIIAARLSPDLLVAYQDRGLDEAAVLAWVGTLSASTGRKGWSGRPPGPPWDWRRRRSRQLTTQRQDLGRVLTDTQPYTTRHRGAPVNRGAEGPAALAGLLVLGSRYGALSALVRRRRPTPSPESGSAARYAVFAACGVAGFVASAVAARRSCPSRPRRPPHRRRSRSQSDAPPWPSVRRRASGGRPGPL